MPSDNPSAKEQAVSTADQMWMACYPSLVVAVNRKINTGNYENLDVFSGISIPILMNPTPDQLEAFQNAASAAAELGFGIVSRETSERYNLIKGMQKEGRPAK